MGSRSRRIAMAVGLIGMGGFLMSGPGTSCTSFVGESGLVAADFCFIFDCVNGPLGGTLDPCSGLGSGGQTFEALVETTPGSGESALPLFTDCEFGP